MIGAVLVAKVFGAVALSWALGYGIGKAVAYVGHIRNIA